MARNSLKNVCRLIDAAKKELPVQDEFLADLKRSIELMDAKNSRLPSKTYKPSSMNCIRNMYYQVQGVQPDESSTSYNFVGICNAGTDIHARIQQAVIDMQSVGMDCEYVNVADFVRSRELKDLDIVKEPDFNAGDYETKLYNKQLNMSFLCDGIVRYKGHYYILELKTETNNKWYSREGVDPKHYAQGTAYSINFDLPEVLFIYIDRDMLNMKSFIFVPTNEMKMELIGKIENCNGYVERNITPPKPKDISKKTCDYCNYKTQCRKDG